MYAKILTMLKLLIVKTSSLGDVVHNLPIINDILSHRQDIEIDWMVEENFADIPKLHPVINQVIPIAIRRWRKNLFSSQTWSEIKALKQQLSQRRYDIVLDTQGLLKSGLLAYLSTGEKHGYDKDSIRESLASHFYDKTHQVSRAQHAIIRNRALAALTFAYPTPNAPPDYGITAKSPPNPVIQEPYIVCLHGTSRDSKLWPTEYWVALGKEFAKKQIKLALPWSSEAEMERAQHIANMLDNATVLPRLTISELAGVISQSEAAIGVDTGLSHLAAALSIPTIAIYTDTNPVLTGVYAGATSAAINLGNVNSTPSVHDVMNAFEKISQKFNSKA